MACSKFPKNIKIKIYGSQKNIKKCIEALEGLSTEQLTKSEGEIRKTIANLVQEHNIEADILYDGNSVWNKKKVLFGIKKVKKYGMKQMTDYLYKFLSLACGSIAHYDKFGWINNYPTLTALKNFFKRNEFGKNVYDHIPLWHTEAKEIVEEIHKELGVKA